MYSSSQIQILNIFMIKFEFKIFKYNIFIDKLMKIDDEMVIFK